jgi:hypothetical protein
VRRALADDPVAGVGSPACSATTGTSCLPIPRTPNGYSSRLTAVSATVTTSPKTTVRDLEEAKRLMREVRARVSELEAHIN